jgi:probable HAF family extracellular repeat protein
MPHLCIRIYAAAAALLCAASAQAQYASFTPIPDLPGGTAFSRARAISPDGSAVAGISSSTNGEEAMRWAIGAAASQGLGDLPGGPFASEAFGCNYNAGTVVGAATNASGNNEAFRWTASTGMTSLGFLPSGGYVSRAFASSYTGTAACGENLFQPTGVPPPLPVTQAFLWSTFNGMQGLGFLPGSSFYSTARAMADSAVGTVVVGWAQDASGVNRPMVWTQQGGMRDLSNGSIVGTARAISPDAQWIVGGDSTTGHAFRYAFPSGPAQDIGVLPGRTSAIAVSATYDGRRIYATCNGGPGQVACLWEEETGWATIADRLAAQGVSTAGWNLTVVLAADHIGATCVGYGINPSGQTQGWAATVQLPRPPCGGICCPDVDFDCDGDTGTDADIAAFFACLAGNCPPPPCCHDSTDINRDGDVGTDADIYEFFRELTQGCC